MKKIILFSGKAENGKTTDAELLKNILESEGQSVVITRYAYYLKDLAKDIAIGMDKKMRLAVVYYKY